MHVKIQAPPSVAGCRDAARRQSLEPCEPCARSAAKSTESRRDLTHGNAAEKCPPVVSSGPCRYRISEEVFLCSFEE